MTEELMSLANSRQVIEALCSGAIDLQASPFDWHCVAALRQR
jgi:hypothetical protein